MERYYNKNLEDCVISVIDIETTGLDTKNGSPILTVGIVTLIPSEWQEGRFRSLSIGIDKKEFDVLGVQDDPRTVEWWSKFPEQRESAIKLATSDFKNYTSLSLLSALGYITEYLNNFNQVAQELKTNHFIFGNSPDFDQAMLNVYYDRLGLARPWQYWQNLDLRTLASIIGNTKEQRELQQKLACKFYKDTLDWTRLDIPPLKHVALYDAFLEAFQIIDGYLGIPDHFLKGIDNGSNS